MEGIFKSEKTTFGDWCNHLPNGSINQFGPIDGQVRTVETDVEYPRLPISAILNNRTNYIQPMPINLIGFEETSRQKVFSIMFCFSKLNVYISRGGGWKRNILSNWWSGSNIFITKTVKADVEYPTLPISTVWNNRTNYIQPMPINLIGFEETSRQCIQLWFFFKTHCLHFWKLRLKKKYSLFKKTKRKKNTPKHQWPSCKKMVVSKRWGHFGTKSKQVKWNFNRFNDSQLVARND